MRRKTTQEFISEVEQKFPGKWLLDKVDYKDNKTNVEIKCRKHGYFKIAPSNLLRGQGCPVCKAQSTGDRCRKTTQEFISEIEQKFPGKWGLDKVDYKNSKTNVEIKCRKHGYWKACPDSLLSGHGCPVCKAQSNADRLTKTTQEFISEIEQKFPGKWGLDRVDYKDYKTNVEIKCRKHGYFKTTPTSLLSGYGCPVCNESKGERLIAAILDNLQVAFTRQKRFKDCKYKRPLPFDFYIPSINMLIEYDGIQHFEAVDIWGGQPALEQTIKKDWIKSKFAQKNGYRLVRFCYDDSNEEITSRLEWLVDRFTARI